MATYERKELEIGQLNVDLSNYRIGEFDSTRSAYRAMIDEEGVDLTNLAADIVENGLSPTELLIVGADEENRGQFVVYEGNRRITALKMLETPTLAADTDLYKTFVRLSKQYLRKPVKKLECVVFKNKDDAMQWIVRRHTTMQGRGLSPWGAPAQARWEASRGDVRPSKAVLDYLRDNDMLNATVDTAMNRRTTNLDRVLQMPYLTKQLGISISRDGQIAFGNGSANAGNRLLKRIVEAIAAPEFNVNDIRHASDRETFIDKFADGAVTGSGTKTESAKPGRQAAKTSPPRRKAPSPDTRTCLALTGKDSALSVQEPRLVALYEEARTIKPDQVPNSAAILTRVFLELSTEHYLQKFQILLPAVHQAKAKTHWSDIGISLKEKIETVLKHLDPAKKDPDLKQARQGASSSDFLHSIQNLHQFVHALKIDVDPDEVKRVWLRWHPYLTKVFDAIAAKKSRKP